MNRCPAIALLLCAWVLWEENDWRVRGKEPSIWWVLSDAYEKRSECVQDRREMIDRFRQLPKKEGVEYEVRGAYTMITWNLDKDGNKGASSRATKLWCLPAGTDPRPRYKQ